jgi:hypothetical protein
MKILILFLIFIACSLLSACNQKFDSISWKENESLRRKMADDLIESNDLLHKTPEEVIQIVGDFDYSEPISLTENAEKSYSFKYLLGGCNWIDFEFLIIKFEQNQVASVYRDCD